MAHDQGHAQRNRGVLGMLGAVGEPLPVFQQPPDEELAPSERLRVGGVAQGLLDAVGDETEAEARASRPSTGSQAAPVPSSGVSALRRRSRSRVAEIRGWVTAGVRTPSRTEEWMSRKRSPASPGSGRWRKVRAGPLATMATTPPFHGRCPGDFSSPAAGVCHTVPNSAGVSP
ncbi:hypothetical protein SF23_03840 [Streptomyces sp. MBRL 10]|nr:hypothetical protein SF23_03840 [Streptomyces sp. MBRL 10]